MSIKEKLNNIKDKIIPRKLGFVDCSFGRREAEQLGIPEKLRGGACYRPIDDDVAVSIKLGQKRELTTFDAAYDQISTISDKLPQFKGLIYSANAGIEWKDASLVMQKYADKYNLPICTDWNNEYRQLLPTSTIAKQRIPTKS